MMNEQAIAMALLHFVWQGAVLAALAALLFRATSSPHVRYAGGCALLAAMAACPALTLLLPSSAGAVVTGGSSVAVALPVVQAQGIEWLDSIVYVWLFGVAAFSVRAAGGLGLAAWNMSRKRTLLEVRSGVRLFASQTVEVPSVIGVLRPAILLPLSALSNLSREELEAVIAHEMAHVRRFDFLVNCVQCAIEALLFYHPAVWWLSNRIREERELCCDAAAVEVCGDAVLYSRALLTLEESRAVFVPAATGGNLRGRIERLLGRDERRSAGPVLVAALVLVLAGGAWSVARAQDPPPPPSPPVPSPAVPAVPPAPRKPARGRTIPPPAPVVPASPPSPVEPPAAVAAPEPRPAPTPVQPPAPRVPPSPKPTAVVKYAAELAATEDSRRVVYAKERFGGHETTRGRIYIQNGPPSEIESHPGTKEVWRYANSIEYEFAEPGFKLVRIRVDGEDYKGTDR